jgi:hypothetical protein
MFCQNCGKEVEKNAQFCKNCGKKLIGDEILNTGIQKSFVPSSQEAVLSAIRKYEESIKLKLGENGGENKITAPESPKDVSTQERPNLKKKQQINGFSKIKIPARVPFRISPEIATEIREKKFTHIVLLKKENGKGLNLCTTKDGKTIVIAATNVNAFSGHSTFKKVEKEAKADVHFRSAWRTVSNSDGTPPLEPSISSTPTTLRSSVTKNQGDVLYQMNQNDNHSNKSINLDDLLAGLVSPDGGNNPLNLIEHKVENVAWHDFSYYEYILEPELQGDISLGKPDIGEINPSYESVSKEELMNELDKIYTVYRNPMQPTNVGEMVLPKIESYPFNIFMRDTCNLGLRLVYRQEWRPLGVQRGETVRTIPLGPKQVEKVSTKIVRRSKTSKTSESLKAVERTTETSDTTKDSTEIVNETSEKFGWHTEAEASASYGFASGKVSGGASGESEEKGKSTNSSLSEKVQKTASKSREETKVIVSTESESTFETTTASEIYNPNDEIAVTYVYSKIQRQYEILTRLAEVNGVVFVAEPVPLLHEIDEQWVRKYDWIISKVLLDDSYRDALTSISQDVPQGSMSPDEMKKIADALISSDNFLTGIAARTQSLSLTSVDPSQEAQRAYRETHKEELERERSRKLLNQKYERLFQHIRENILHYCRAIWSQEDSEQRMLRYDKLNIRIPTVWKFITNTGVEITNISSDTVLVEGYFVPDLSNPETVRRVTEIINPAGPVGFAGNYAVFHMKPDAEIDALHQNNLFDMLHLMRGSYYDPASKELIDPALRYFIENDEYDPPDNIHRKMQKKMVEYVPQIRADYELEKAKEGFDKEQFFTDKQRWDQYKEDYYYEYLFREEYSRRFLVDTNNLMVDILVGSGSALEPFKKLHRFVDVQKAIEEKTKMELENVKMELENSRRDGLLTAKKYGDPDIDKVVVVSDGKFAEELIAEETG